MILVKIFYGILLFFTGVALIKYRRIVKSWTGNFVWAERYLGMGGTYFVLILIGFFLMFVGVLYPVGGLDFIFSK
ncbi:hypothetical protein HGA92_01865 [Candidatus Gracilibacteria bacterium]|nr:hypothetical protein [Candidatus Gracilibacteria bacterium]NUJ99474.1 hypothetical protein [Candidatus Gracilibacteria bacterium]